MEGSARHKSQPVDSNLHNASFDVLSSRFAFTPGQLDIFLDPKDAEAFCAFRHLEGPKNIRSDFPSRDRSSMDSTAGCKTFSTSNRAIPTWLESDDSIGESEDTSIASGVPGQSVLGSRKTKQVPKSSPKGMLTETHKFLPLWLILTSLRICLRHDELQELAMFLDTCRLLLLTTFLISRAFTHIFDWDMIHHVPISDIQFLNLGNVVPADGVLIQDFGITWDRSSVREESYLAKETTSGDMPDVLNRMLEAKRPKRANKLDPSPLPDVQLSNRAVCYPVSKVGQNTGFSRVQSPVSDTAPPEAGFEEQSIFASLPWLLLSCVCYNNKTHSVEPWLLSFLMLGICIIHHRRRIKAVGRHILTSSQHVVLDANRTSSIGDKRREPRHLKSALALMALFYAVPVAAVVWEPVRALRIVSGFTAGGAAAGAVSLHKMDGIPWWAWIVDYGVWMIFYAMYLALQVHHIPRHRGYRRQLYLVVVIFLATNVATTLAKSSPTLIDGFTIFGPLVLTGVTFAVALLFHAIAAMEARGGDGGTGENAPDTSHRLADIATAAMGMSV